MLGSVRSVAHVGEKKPLTEALKSGADALPLRVPPVALEKLERLLVLLDKWNHVYNLTAIRDPSESVSHHILDSLAVAEFLPEGRLADVGSGAGFPGIPLALACPQRQVVLIDSSQKKAAFMQQAVLELGLGNVTVIHSRVEAYRPQLLFPVVISRAFAELSQFISAARHLCSPGGRLIAMKGLRPDEELAGIPPAAIERVVRLTVPGLRAQRHLVVVDPAKSVRD